jgi:hypothetical protein
MTWTSKEPFGLRDHWQGISARRANTWGGIKSLSPVNSLTINKNQFFVKGLKTKPFLFCKLRKFEASTRLLSLF